MELVVVARRYPGEAVIVQAFPGEAVEVQALPGKVVVAAVEDSGGVAAHDRQRALRCACREDGIHRDAPLDQEGESRGGSHRNPQPCRIWSYGRGEGNDHGVEDLGGELQGMDH